MQQQKTVAPEHLGGFDIIIVGAGHAGVEAAYAASKLGVSVGLFTLTLDGIANMPCNPSIGGTAKGHLVREIDAMGGVMGVAADANTLQSRMLNRGKGPAVHSLRAQIDRVAYHNWVKHFLEQCPNLCIKQAEVASIDIQDGKVAGVVTRLNGYYDAKAVVLCTGTNLGGKIFVGSASVKSGPDGQPSADALVDCLKEAGLPLRRFKTGTPARVHRRSVDFSVLEPQPGEEPPEPFSFMTPEGGIKNQVDCHITFTNPTTHQVILDNLHRSPLYGGAIEGIGPRYCPSIEDKVVRFSDKERHQVFVEPCGLDTEEMYLQGLSSSLPEQVQNEMYHTIKGFENIEIMRPAYAIEYECIDPLALRPTLETRAVEGLFGAGQFNGTSGYEEAAAQGLLAGLNAARKVKGEEGLVLPRHTSYMGALVDDLVTKGVMDPYRMMTSRSEYRLTLRQDNADERLTPIGREMGLVDDARWNAFQKRMEVKETEMKRLSHTTVRAALLDEVLAKRGVAPMGKGGPAAEMLRRPEVDYSAVAAVIGWGEGVDERMAGRITTEIKYAGYIARQQRAIKEVKRLEKTRIPEDFDYAPLDGLRLEAREKLAKVRPLDLAQAGRIPGVSPADMAVLSVAVAAACRNNNKAEETK